MVKIEKHGQHKFCAGFQEYSRNVAAGVPPKPVHFETVDEGKKVLGT